MTSARNRVASGGLLKLNAGRYEVSYWPSTASCSAMKSKLSNIEFVMPFVAIKPRNIQLRVLPMLSIFSATSTVV